MLLYYILVSCSVVGLFLDLITESSDRKSADESTNHLIDVVFSLVVTSEALFSLINGDDMYMTYEEMSLNNQYAWVFSQVILS